jgi:hypothetical protein
MCEKVNVPHHAGLVESGYRRDLVGRDPSVAQMVNAARAAPMRQGSCDPMQPRPAKRSSHSRAYESLRS